MLPPTDSFLNRQEWLAARKVGIGGSEASVVMGCSPYSSRIRLWCEKTGLEDSGTEENEAMSWGRRLEPLVCEAYAEETARRVVHWDRAIWRHPDGLPMFASLDASVVRVDRDAGVLEIKTMAPWVWTGDIPLHHMVQVQHYLACTGATWGSYAVLVGGQRLFWQDIERDDAFIKVLRAECQAFWQMVVEGNPPDPDGSEASKAALRAMFPEAKAGSAMDLPPEAQEWDEVIQGCDAQIQWHENLKRKAESNIMKALGEVSEGRLPEGVTWKWANTKTGRRLRRSVRL